ncbi:MAG TPA: hypothetical protein VFI54_04190 [Solirubrobacteraceae bacterium]|nr:hypothetical protein [Solirubrobacteraceae bacterium]
MRLQIVLVAGLCALAAGCGSGSKSIPTGTDGAVVFRDSLADNHNGWIDIPQDPHRNGRWDWNDVPRNSVEMADPDALHHAKLPAAVSVGVNVEMRHGAALRVISCHEYGTPSTVEGTYELGIDGRRALIRELKLNNPPRVLAAQPLPVANGRRARLVARCVPDGDAVALSLLVDGKVVAQARAAHPLPAGIVGLHAVARPDSAGPADLTWDDFIVRNAARS